MDIGRKGAERGKGQFRHKRKSICLETHEVDACTASGGGTSAGARPFQVLKESSKRNPSNTQMERGDLNTPLSTSRTLRASPSRNHH